MGSLKSLLLQSKAIAENTPHNDLKEYIPFNRDEDILTVLESKDLSNTLYTKVCHMYSYLGSSFMQLLLHSVSAS